MRCRGECDLMPTASESNADARANSLLDALSGLFDISDTNIQPDH